MATEKLERASSTVLPPPMDGGYGWVVCFACFATSFICDGIPVNFGIVMDQVIQDLELDPGLTTVIPSLLWGGTMLFSPVACYALDRWGMKMTATMGSIYCLLCISE